MLSNKKNNSIKQEPENIIENPEKKREESILGQELSIDELEAAAGGIGKLCGASASQYEKEKDKSNCLQSDKRYIYAGAGFPNCAATVEDGSWCGVNDACYRSAIDYQGMTDCSKAWR